MPPCTHWQRFKFGIRLRSYVEILLLRRGPGVGEATPDVAGRRSVGVGLGMVFVHEVPPLRSVQFQSVSDQSAVPTRPVCLPAHMIAVGRSAASARSLSSASPEAVVVPV